MLHGATSQLESHVTLFGEDQVYDGVVDDFLVGNRGRVDEFVLSPFVLEQFDIARVAIEELASLVFDGLKRIRWLNVHEYCVVQPLEPHNPW